MWRHCNLLPVLNTTVEQRVVMAKESENSFNSHVTTFNRIGMDNRETLEQR